MLRFNYLNKRKSNELETLAEMIFNGEYDEEVFAEYGQWRLWIGNIFLPIVNTETGDFSRLPYDGGIMEQGYISMEILYKIQSIYRKTQFNKLHKI